MFFLKNYLRLRNAFNLFQMNFIFKKKQKLGKKNKSNPKINYLFLFFLPPLFSIFFSDNLIIRTFENIRNSWKIVAFLLFFFFFFVFFSN